MLQVEATPKMEHRCNHSTIGTADSRYGDMGDRRASLISKPADRRTRSRSTRATRPGSFERGKGHAPQAAPGTQRNRPPDLSVVGNSGPSCVTPPPECERVKGNPARSSGPAVKAAAPHFEDSTKSVHAGWCAMASKQNRSSSSCDRGLSGIDVSINFIGSGWR